MSSRLQEKPKGRRVHVPKTHNSPKFLYIILINHTSIQNTNGRDINPPSWKLLNLGISNSDLDI